jgi:hypothetical protein
MDASQPFHCPFAEGSPTIHSETQVDTTASLETPLYLLSLRRSHGASRMRW